jgi:uncharacterized integral membrane protein (TIGR00698 family)
MNDSASLICLLGAAPAAGSSLTRAKAAAATVRGSDALNSVEACWRTATSSFDVWVLLRTDVLIALTGVPMGFIGRRLQAAPPVSMALADAVRAWLHDDAGAFHDDDDVCGSVWHAHAMRERAAQAAFAVGAIGAAVSPWPALGLALGVALALTLKNPWPKQSKQAATWVLQASVVLLGFGMDLFGVLRAGRDGALAALLGITATLLVGRLLGRALGVPSTTSWLISVGTAICGGSAIAACAPVLGAKDEELAASTGTVFVLNAIALVVFPPLGVWLALDDRAFGMFAALAIHDTSSVVGAASAFSTGALAVAVTVKLARALFILPLPFVLMGLSGTRSTSAAKKPWFVVLFLVAAAVATFVPVVHDVGGALTALGKHGLGVALYLIGTGLTWATLKSVGPRPLVQGVVLWALVIAGTLGALRAGLL